MRQQQRREPHDGTIAATVDEWIAGAQMHWRRAGAQALGVPMEVTQAVAQALARACAEIGGEQDLTTVVQPLERRAGVEVRATKG